MVNIFSLHLKSSSKNNKWFFFLQNRRTSLDLSLNEIEVLSGIEVPRGLIYVIFMEKIRNTLFGTS